jgi:quinone-modifying oxidoreductase subunit QmoB
VLGGGFAGINAALSVAGAGYEVVLVEKAGSLGGKALSLYKTFPLKYPYLEATDTGIERLIAQVAGNSKIQVRLNTTLTTLAGAPGIYQATLSSNGKEETLPIGSVVLAAGWTPMGTEALAPFGYGPTRTWSRPPNSRPWPRTAPSSGRPTARLRTRSPSWST